jgi:hypothetical protein
MAKRSEDVIEAKRVNSAYIVVSIVTRLYMITKPRFDLVYRSVCIGDAGDGARRVPDLIDGPGEFGDDDPCLTAAGTGSEHEIIIASYGVLLLERQRHGATNHAAASARYLGIWVA